MEIKSDQDKTEQEIETEQIANLKLMAAIRQRALRISEIPAETRKLIDCELFYINSINCNPELTKWLKSKENAIHYERIGELSHDFLKQILPDK